MRMRHLVTLLAVGMLAISVGACNNDPPTSDQVQQYQQEQEMNEAVAQTGQPNIVNFRERKLLKLIYELRDQKGLVTYTYTYNQMTGKFVFFCNSIGYGIPYATQYTNPEIMAYTRYNGEAVTLPQADPNALFSPADAEGTWVLCQTPTGKVEGAEPVYVEPRIMVSPFKFDTP